MGNTYLTVIGTGRYEPCTYKMADHEWTSRYIQEAVLRILKEEGVQIDRIVCLATSQAREGNWESYNRVKGGLKNRELRDVDVPKEVEDFLRKHGLWENVNETDQGLKELLLGIYPDAGISCVEIPLGSNEEELLQIFEAMYRSIGEEDHLYIDVTHGFRSMPMLYIPVLKYAQALKNIRVEGIYYGAYEARGEKKPIFDLGIYNEILDWAFASNNFIQYGISAELFEVAKRRQGIRARMKDFSFNEAKSFVEKLNRFTECIQTGRGNEVSVRVQSGEKKTEAQPDCIRSEYRKLEKIDYSKIEFPILRPLLDNIRESIAEFKTGGNTATGLATIHWCAEKGMIQQGYTALEETIKTFVCDLYHYENETDKRIRDGAVGAALSAGSDLLKQCEQTRESRERFYGENQEKFFEMLEGSGWRLPEEEYVPLFRRVLTTIPMGFVELAAEVKNKRNDINHFGMRSNSSKPQSLMRVFKEQVKRFDELYATYQNGL